MEAQLRIRAPEAACEQMEDQLYTAAGQSKADKGVVRARPVLFTTLLGALPACCSPSGSGGPLPTLPCTGGPALPPLAASQLPYVSPAGDGGQLGRGPQGELAHANEVLRDLGQALLVLVHQELGPVLQVLVHLQAQRQGTSAATVSVFGQTRSLYTRSSAGAIVGQARSCAPRIGPALQGLLHLQHESS